MIAKNFAWPQFVLRLKARLMLPATQWVIAVEIGLLWVIASFFLPGGDDLYRYYEPFQNGCNTCGFVPLFARWFLWPLTVLPGYPLTWPLWTMISVSSWLVLAYYTKTNPLLFMLSFPLWGQLWLGQVDWLIAFGLVLFLLHGNPAIRGAGIVLALVKPQLGFLPVFFILIQEKPDRILKILLLPLAALGLSLIIYGWRWPQEWLINSMRTVPVHQWRLAGLDTWRIGILFIWLPLLFRDKKQRMIVSLLISAVATPFFGVYSYVIFMLFLFPWWAVPVSYAWIITQPWLGENGMRIAWILPVSLIIWMLYQRHNDWQKTNTIIQT